MSKKKNWTEEKRKLLDEIQAFLNSPEMKTVRESFKDLNERISKIPSRELSVFDNFTNASVAFFNMMNWATDFSWNRNMKVFNFMFDAEHKQKEE